MGSGGGGGGGGSVAGRAAGCTAPRRPGRFDALARAYALATGALWWSHRSISRVAPSGPVIVQVWAGSLPHRSHARTSTTFLAMIARLSDHRTRRLALLPRPQPDADVVAQPRGSRQMCALGSAAGAAVAGGRPSPHRQPSGMTHDARA